MELLEADLAWHVECLKTCTGHAELEAQGWQGARPRVRNQPPAWGGQGATANPSAPPGCASTGRVPEHPGRHRQGLGDGTHDNPWLGQASPSVRASRSRCCRSRAPRRASCGLPGDGRGDGRRRGSRACSHGRAKCVHGYLSSRRPQRAGHPGEIWPGTWRRHRSVGWGNSPPFPGQGREPPLQGAVIAPRSEANEIAAALAASLRRTNPGVGGKTGTRSRSGTRSPTQASRKEGGVKKLAGGGTPGAGASSDASDGLKLLQTTLGLTGAGVPVPDEDDV